MTVYICTKCDFCFGRMDKIETCPNCDCTNIRNATEAETAEYKRKFTKERERVSTHDA
jgi:hypothetical protein